jgi:hypothetical protein
MSNNNNNDIIIVIICESSCALDSEEEEEEGVEEYIKLSSFHKHVYMLLKLQDGIAR